MLPSLDTIPTTTREESLPSGRSVVVRVEEGGEVLEVRSPDGLVEVQVILGEGGPVVRLSAGRLELAALEDVSVRCRRFAVHSSEGTELTSDGNVSVAGQEMRVRTTGDIHMNGDVIRLNCDETP